MLFMFLKAHISLHSCWAQLVADISHQRGQRYAQQPAQRPEVGYVETRECKYDKTMGEVHEERDSSDICDQLPQSFVLNFIVICSGFI